MENLHNKQSEVSYPAALTDHDADQTAAALERISKEFHELLHYAGPEELHSVAWDMFQTYLMANANEILPDNIYTYTLLYESIRNICTEVGKIPPVAGSRFRVMYEPEAVVEV